MRFVLCVVQATRFRDSVTHAGLGDELHLLGRYDGLADEGEDLLRSHGHSGTL